MIKIKELFGKKIKEYRKNRKLTQAQLAEMVNVDDKHISCIESGKNFPSADLIERFAVALEVEPKDLFEFYYLQEPHDLKENISENESFKEALNEPMLNIFSGVGFANNTYTFTLSRYVNYNREASHAIALIEFDFTEIVRTISQTDLGKNGHIVIFDHGFCVSLGTGESFI